jgi:transcriptional repressor NrdR
MHCPFCRAQDSNVIDSRLGKEGNVVRRRRRCPRCTRRFTTYERVEEVFPLIVKKDGRREPYDRAKVLAGLQRACEKRPVSADTLAAVADRIAQRIQEEGTREVPSSLIGEAVMRELRELDTVAYVRFASVYRSFEDVGEFMRAVQALGKRPSGRAAARRRRQ